MRMNRRTLLKRSGISIATLVALSGCTEETLKEAETKPPFLDIDEEELDLPVNQRADVVEDGVLQAEDSEINEIEDFEAFLKDHGIPLEELAETEKIIEEKLEIEREDVEVIEEKAHGEGLVLELEFIQPDRIETGILYSIGLVAGGYAALVDGGYDAELLEAEILDEDRRLFGTFEILTAWAEEYNNGITSLGSTGVNRGPCLDPSSSR